MRERILVVDDDPLVREFVVQGLKDAGYEVFAFAEGKDVVAAVNSHNVDVAIVDVILPDINGLELVKRIRQYPHVGILVLSGQDEVTDRIVGLEVGADDYMTKPFRMRELLARLHSVLRRTGKTEKAAAPAEGKQCYEFDGWQLDPSSYTVRRPDGSQLYLTTGEFKVLEFLVAHPNRFWDAQQLSEMITASGVPTAVMTVTSCIKRLRVRLGEDARHPRLIGTVRGSGYKFLPKVVSIPANTHQ
jgi:two-component system phosphate regulon response regulator OmpR